MSAELDELRMLLADKLEEARKLFKFPEQRRLTILVRQPGEPERDCVVTDDTPEGIREIVDRRAERPSPGPQEAVATTLLPDPYDEREGPWFTPADWKRLAALPARTPLYAHPQDADYRGIVKEICEKIDYTFTQGAEETIIEILKRHSGAGVGEK